MNEQQIEMIEKEIKNLEEAARIDSLLGPPKMDNDSTFFDEKVHSIFSDDPKYWESKKLPGHRIPYSDPAYIADLKSIRLSQKKRNETREERVIRNKEKYFSKAEEVIFLTEIGISYVKEKNYEDAINAFKEAYKECPHNDSTGLFTALCFNLGKAYFESGNAELGVYYLARYCAVQSEGDYYKSVLDKLLNLDYKTVSANDILRGGTIEGKKFKYTKSKVSFSQPIKLQNPMIELAYKIPYNLELEYIDSDEITLLDYRYLITLDNPSSETTLFEVMLPLNKVSHFMEEFSVSIAECDVKIELLNNLNTLKTELFVAEKLFSSLKQYEKRELGTLQAMKSVALLEVPTQQAKQVIDIYKRYLTLFVLEQKTDEELVQIEIAKVKEAFDRESYTGLEQGMGEFHSEYMHHMKVMDVYASNRAALVNLKKGIRNPLISKNKYEYEKAKKDYRSLLGVNYSNFEKAYIKKEEQYIFGNLTVRTDWLRILLSIQWTKMNEFLVIDPTAAVQRSRVLIEAVMHGISQSKEFSYRGKNWDGLNLKGKCDGISRALDTNTPQKLCKLRRLGNLSYHYRENSYGEVKPISTAQATQQIKDLEEVITALVERFKL